jgi:hypothetical protein
MQRLVNWLHIHQLKFFLGAFLVVALLTLGGC